MVNHLVKDLDNLEEISFFPFSQPFADKIVFEGVLVLERIIIEMCD